MEKKRAKDTNREEDPFEYDEDLEEEFQRELERIIC